MEIFSNALPDALKKLGLQRRFSSASILLHWREIVGDKISAHTNPIRIQRSILIVGTSNSVWAHHLMTLKEEFITKINDFSGEKVISDIKFQAGYLKNDQNEENSDDYEPFLPSWKKITLSQNDMDAIDRIINNVSNEELRHKVKGILCKDFSLRQAKRKKEWTDCPECGTLCPPEEGYCPLCTIDQRTKMKDTIRSMLKETPWLDYKECSQYISCHICDFNTVKNELIDNITREVSQNEINNLRLATLVMLVNKVKPDEISQEIIDKTLDNIRRKKNVFAPRR
ncbi:MAG: DUF721 domain-containing protein [Negativicutes bacterium]|nr:DUF721 domain-containing protein [Negativicutes bacterium]